MSFLALKAARPVSVLLLDASGGNAARWTLQVESREGRVLRWTPEGVLRQLGSGAGHSRLWNHQGWRRELAIRWDVGIVSTREAWDGSAWSAPEERTTAEAHSEIHGWRSGAVIAEPFLGSEFGAFEVATFERGLAIRDAKRVAHTGLELVLTACDLVAAISFLSADGYGWSSYGWGAWGY